jgi:hypothetical protein
MKEFLESNGYKMWKEEGNDIHHTMYFQKRVDTLYQDSPVCLCNDKLFINLDVWTMNEHTSCSVSMTHERPEDEWCSLKIYSLTQEQIESNLTAYEDKMIKLWEVFYD